MPSRPLRAVTVALAVMGVIAAAACGDTDNDNQGVFPLTGDAGSCTNAMGMMVECDAGMTDSGMFDSGMLGDSGMADSGMLDAGQCMMSDGGMDMTCACDAGMSSNCGPNMMGPRSVWVLNTQSGAEGQIGINPVDAGLMAMSYGMMNGFGGISGTPESHVLSNEQTYSYVAFSQPAKLVSIDMGIIGSSNTPGELSLGTASDRTANVVWSAGGKLLVSGETANKISVVTPSAASATLSQTIAATDLTGLLAPSAIRVNAQKTLAVIASSNATQTKIFFLELAANGTVTARNDRTLTLTDGTTTGTGPTVCNWMQNGSEGFCAVTSGTDTSGTAPASLWHFTYGGAPKRVLTSTAVIKDILVSPDDTRLYFTNGTEVRSHFIGGSNKLAPIFIQSRATGAGAGPMTFDSTKQYLFVANVTANSVTQLDAIDLDLVTNLTGSFNTPESLYAVP